jgi:hypothetical protein
LPHLTCYRAKPKSLFAQTSTKKLGIFGETVDALAEEMKVDGQ